MAVSIEDQRFRVDGFQIKSKTFLYFLLICMALGGVGVGFLIAIPSLLVCFYVIYPGLYRGLTRLLVKLSNHSIVKVLSIIPNIEFRGEWYQQLRPENKTVRTLANIWSFVKSNILELTVIHLIFLIAGLNFGLLFQGGEPNPDRVFYGLAPGTILTAIFLLPILTGFYFIVIWTIEDAGLKLYRLKETTDIKSRQFEGLFELSDSFRTLSGLLFGFPSLFWLIDYGRKATFAPLGTLPYYLNIVIFVVLLYFLTIGVTIFSLISFYRSDKYEYSVNDLRLWIHHSSRDYAYQYHSASPPTMKQPITKEESTREDEIEFPEKTSQDQEQVLPKNFCTGCGSKLNVDQKFCNKCGKKI